MEYMNKLILKSIARCLRTCGADGNLTSLFDTWSEQDTDISIETMNDELISFERNFDQLPSDTTDFIKIKEFTIQVRYIASIEPIDDYDGSKGVPLYKLLINRDERSKISFANTEVVFASASERQRELQRVTNALRDFADVRFL